MQIHGCPFLTTVVLAMPHRGHRWRNSTVPRSPWSIVPRGVACLRSFIDGRFEGEHVLRRPRSSNLTESPCEVGYIFPPQQVTHVKASQASPPRHRRTRKRRAAEPRRVRTSRNNEGGFSSDGPNVSGTLCRKCSTLGMMKFSRMRNWNPRCIFCRRLAVLAPSGRGKAAAISQQRWGRDPHKTLQ